MSVLRKKVQGEFLMIMDKQGPVTSVAWYKLADLITRGEREKVLSVYRLLAHSLEDRAYALQLEGDILLALDDPRSKDKYFQAATLYKNDKRWVDAVALSEHLIDRHPKDPALRLFAAYCYAVLDMQQKTDLHYDLFKKLRLELNLNLELFTEELALFRSLQVQKPWLARVIG
jgi:hypothetical protein